MKKGLLFIILLSSLLLAACSAADHTEEGDLHNKAGILDTEDFKGRVNLFVTSPHVQAFSEDFGITEAPYDILQTSSAALSEDNQLVNLLEDETTAIGNIFKQCSSVEPKRAAQMAELTLLGTGSYQKCIFPKMLFICHDHRYMYYIDFYSPVPEEHGDIGPQLEYGDREHIVAFISKLIIPADLSSDEEAFEYALKYGSSVNIWTASAGDIGSVGMPWISVISRNSLDSIMDSIKTMDVLSTTEGVGKWQELPEFNELYK